MRRAEDNGLQIRPSNQCIRTVHHLKAQRLRIFGHRESHVRIGLCNRTQFETFACRKLAADDTTPPTIADHAHAYRSR